MSWHANLREYHRFAFGLRRFLRETETLETATARIRGNLARREPHLLALLEHAVFRHPRSPYLPLFKQADCGLEDVRRMLAVDGVEKTLGALADAGVYVTFEEFKGRRPIVRDGREYPVAAGDFDNPLRAGWMQMESSGSSGAPTRVTHDLDFLRERVAHFVVGLACHDILDAPSALWRGLLPDGSGLNIALLLGRAGRPPLRWFTATGHGPLRDLRLLKFRIAHLTTLVMSRAAGAAIPWPELADVDDAGRVAAWMAETVRASGKCAAFMVVSRAVRVARAAVDRGLDLTGATFVAAGEPASPARVSAIRRSGAALMTTYGQVEAGRIGMGCCEADDASDVHVLSDVCSVVMSSRRLPPLVEPRAALDLTVLVPTAPKVILNTGLDDCAILETRTCGCALGRLGLTTHLRSIRSYGKFTSEGVTVLESEIAHIVEAVLPARFGGTAIDYQLLEEEDETGRARVTLVVNPALPMPADAELIRAVLEGLGRESLGAEAARQVWARTGSLTVRRARPVVTARGKMNAVYRVRT